MCANQDLTQPSGQPKHGKLCIRALTAQNQILHNITISVRLCYNLTRIESKLSRKILATFVISGQACLLVVFRYKSDFGATDLEVLKFVARFLTLKERDKLEALISEGKYKIEYQPYDWSANSAE